MYLYPWANVHVFDKEMPSCLPGKKRGVFMYFKMNYLKRKIYKNSKIISISMEVE